MEYVIPSQVVDALRDVAALHQADMYDRETVLKLAATVGHADAAAWLAMNRHLYFRALLQTARGRLPAPAAA